MDGLLHASGWRAWAGLGFSPAWSNAAFARPSAAPERRLSACDRTSARHTTSQPSKSAPAAARAASRLRN